MLSLPPGNKFHMNIAYHRIRRTAAILTGLVFFFAGALKLMDPTGAGLVVADYLSFFHLGFLSPLSKAIGVGMAFLETAVGAALILGVWKKVVAIITSVLIAIFTIITLILAIFNPQMDCGCFGEAIHLSHMQTFLKNLGLCLVAALAFLPFRELGGNRTRKLVTFPIVLVLIALFTIHQLFSLPLIDFTSFRPGTELSAGWTEDLENLDVMPPAQFIYEKDGQRQTFSLENLPDSTWTFVDAIAPEIPTKADNDGFVNLPFRDAEGNSRDSLAITGKVFAISVTQPSKLSPAQWQKAASALSAASDNGFTPLLLAAATPASLEEMIKPMSLQNGAEAILLMNAYSADYRTLISLNRSNGGATWFDDGQLICKWPAGKLPSSSALRQAAADNPLEHMISYDTRGRIASQAWLIAVFAVMILF